MRYLALLLCLSFTVVLSAQDDRSLSPYFMVNVDSGETVPDFPLQKTSAEVEIAGVIADVTITQVYINHSTRPVEAVYVFPGSTNAAVYAMEMQIGRRTITAEIHERVEAQQQYQQAKSQGRTASLLEQDRPNVFTMNVANIMPGDSILVRMSYTERLIPTNGTYEFVYPTVVGPRYTGAGAQVYAINDDVPVTSKEGVPYTKEGVAPAYDFDITVSVASAIPFEFIKSTSHKILLSFSEKRSATVLLDPSERNGGNRDFILQYRFAAGKIETGLMLYEGKDENFFMLQVQPPARVPLDSIPPREYIFVMDVSGSMSGFPLEVSKKLLRNLVSGLRPTDKFNVVLFAGTSSLFSPQSVEANAANIDSAITFMARPGGSGGTELNAAMRTAMSIPKPNGYSRSIVIVTDGLISAEAEVLATMREQLDSANVFSFGIGLSCNRYLIEGMAFCGNGDPAVVTQPTEADSAAARFRRYISSPVLTGIHVQYEGFDAYDVEPSAVPDLFAERPLVITGKYHGKATGKIVIDGTTGGGAYHKEINVDSIRPRKQNKAIRLLWARDRVKYLGYLDRPPAYGIQVADSSIKNEILNIGLKYGIITSYTSFLAVDRRERNKEGITDSTILQPLPLPAGIGNPAIGFFGVISGVANMSCALNVVEVACTSGPAIMILPERESLPVNTLTRQYPTTLGDANWNINGGYLNPVISSGYQPFFSNGASGRIGMRIPDLMLADYSYGPLYYRPGMNLYTPMNSGSMNMTSWSYPSHKIMLSATHRGTENFYADFDFRLRNPRFKSFLEINQEWNPLKLDDNEDGHTDVPTGPSLSIHNRTVYRCDDYDSSSLYKVTNDLFFHYSAFQARETAGMYNTMDNAIGIYDAPQFAFRFSNDRWLFVKSSFGYASLYDEWGANRFHLNTSVATASAEYEMLKGIYGYYFGVAGSLSRGEEKWNTVRQSDAYNSGSGYINFALTPWRWKFILGLRGDYDDVNGGVLIPSARAGFAGERWNFSLNAMRYRSVPFAMGQVLPLFNSSRELQWQSPGANQGWEADLIAGYWNSSQWHVLATYSAILPEHSVIVNTDADAGKIMVYGVRNGPLMHRGKIMMEIKLSARITLKGEYMINVFRYNYSGSLLQQPLLPVHRIFANAGWKSNSERFFASMQFCYSGAQRLPQHDWSRGYGTFNVHVRYKTRTTRWEFFASAFNVLDYRQENIIMSTGADGQFDSWMVWAPLTGRTFQAGVTMKLN